LRPREAEPSRYKQIEANIAVRLADEFMPNA
jgi:hypothetical protein